MLSELALALAHELLIAITWLVEIADAIASRFQPRGYA